MTLLLPHQRITRWKDAFILRPVATDGVLSERSVFELSEVLQRKASDLPSAQRSIDFSATVAGVLTFCCDTLLDMDDEILITAVQDYPCLYDTTKRSYHDKICKYNAWTAVATIVHLSVDECKRRWKAVRDKYRREIEKKEKGLKSGAGQLPGGSWDMLKTLEFIAPFTAPRSTTSNVVDPVEPPVTYTLELCDDSVADPDASLVDQENHFNEKAASSLAHGVGTTKKRSLSPVEYGRKKKKKPSVPSDVDKIVQAIETISDGNPTAEDDADELFLKSLLPDIKAMPQGKKQLFKMQLMKLIVEFA